AGRLVGKVAREYYPGGVEIGRDDLSYEEAVRRTTAALADLSTRAIYEGAFSHGGIRARVDILARANGSGWDLVEVKSSTGFKGEYLADVAAQLHAVEGSGVQVERVLLLHVNNQYVWNGGAYDVAALFAAHDLSEGVRAALPKLLGKVGEIRQALGSPEPPAIAIGPHCRKPYPCPFHGHCHEAVPEHHVSNLPRLTPKMYGTLIAARIEDIREIPDGFEGLSEFQWRVRDAVLRGEPYRHPGLKAELDAIRFPIHFLDFETCNPALPIIPGTHPFQQTPFQWSVHVLREDGTHEHHGYLHRDRTDPREALASGLVDVLADRGSIVVYSGFESRVIRSLADALPELEDRLNPLQDRMVDLLHLLHNYYYHPNFHGSFSIKDVLPVLVPAMSYDDLSIREGSQAALAFIALTDPEIHPEERAMLEEALNAYCARDTMALLCMYQVLRGMP
ncbi:MAG TPA: DUF2779 domain-containing protein, partial [Candidatus Eisenbacteria bacterium]|nr:DUF2779 domain-containing protein [Candidatus Eisenbacteria bacterium]